MHKNFLVAFVLSLSLSLRLREPTQFIMWVEKMFNEKHPAH